MNSVLPPLPLVDGTLFVSSSFLETVDTCSRQSEYYKLHNRILATERPALMFGKHIHTALEAHYKLQQYNLSSDELQSRVSSILVKAFEDTPIDCTFRSLNWAQTVYERYCERFSEEQFSLLHWPVPRPCRYCPIIGQDPKNKGDIIGYKEGECLWCLNTRQNKIMAEVSFAFPLTTLIHQGRPLPIFYHGIIDLPVLLHEGIYTRDFKTTTVLGEGFFKDIKMSAQQKGYCKGLIETINQPVKGHIATALRVKEPPQYMGNVLKLKEQTKWWSESFQEEPYHLGEGELEEWQQTTIAKVEEFLWHHSRGFFPKKTKWCVGKYGTCQYYEVCSLFPVEDRHTYLYSGFYKDKEPSLELFS